MMVFLFGLLGCFPYFPAENFPEELDHDYDKDLLTENQGDCNDLDPNITIGPWYYDGDRDGFGDLNNSTQDCSQLASYVTDSTDCNDNDVSIFPGNARNESEYACVQDEDGDGYGSMNPSVPADFGTDCNDASAQVYPGSNEESGELCVLDQDGDGYGDTNAAPPYEVGTDCNDLDRNTYPGNNEESGNLCVLDQDGDGFGEIDSPYPYASGTDCDDSSSQVNPDAQERCDEMDNDCNGEIDEYDGSSAPLWYGDDDGDGFGDPDTTVHACTAPEFYVSNPLDCNDNNASIYPNAPEICADGDADGDGEDDPVDNNCNGLIDEDSAIDVQVWFSDADGDGFGSFLNVESSCAPSTGYVDNSDDCNDNNMAIYPNAEEVCNGMDDDCDGQTDEGSPTMAPLWYLDNDDDGFGDASVSQQACTAPSGYVADNSDCDDSLDSVYPAAPEYCNNIDDDCDIVVDDNALDSEVFYIDNDGDGRGSPAQTLISCLYQNLSVPAGYSEYDDDCDDNDPSRSPHFSELCTDTIDENCDGDPLFAAVDLTTYYADSDTDGYGNVNLTIEMCSMPFGYVENADDCNDTDSDVQPFMPVEAEICNGKTDRCENQSLQLVDEIDDDGDGYVECELDVNPLLWGDQANIPIGGRDCDDSNSDRYPNAPELCNGIFEDCASSYYLIQTTPDLESDDDGDGFVECTYYSSVWASSTVVQGGDDCDDSSDVTYVGAAANYPTLCAQDSDFDGEPDCNLTGISQDYGCGYGIFYPNGIAPDFNLITGGMDPLGRYELTYDYYIMTTEITIGMWDTVLGGSDPYSIYPKAIDKGRFLDFVNQLSIDSGLDTCYDTSADIPKPEYMYDIASCPGYRLPTEAEWDYAARAGTTSDFWTGYGVDNGGTATNGGCDYDAIIADGNLNPYLRDYAWFCGNSNSFQPVAQLLPNGFGLYDLHGNIAEWVNDDNGGSFPYGSFQNPNGDYQPTTGYLARGGIYSSLANSTRVEARGFTAHHYYLGVRVARTEQ